MDTIVGSAGDDTITAPATVATTGAAQTTINSGDSIDGGAGTDTLTLTITGANNNSLTGLTIKNVENIVYSGLNNLASGATQNAADNTAAAAAAALVVATNAKVAADAAKVVTLAEESAAVYIATGGTAPITSVATATTQSTADSPSANFTKAQYNAAVKALLTQADGVTLTTDATIVARSVALKDLKTAIDTKADDAVTAANAALATASFNATNTTATAAASKAAIGALTLAANADATSITIDGTKTTVTGLKDTQTLTIKATSVDNTASYAAAATVANIALSSATGKVTIADGGTADATAAAKALATAKVTGSVKATAATDAAGVSSPGAITLVDAITGTSALKTLTLGLTSDAAVTATSLTKVTTIDASSSTGGVDLTIGTGVMNITTGAGKDKVTFAPATTATTAATLTATLNTGAGNDSITVNHTGTGTATVDAGAGDDSVTMTSALGTATVNGGDGKDTVTMSNASFSVGGYNNLKSSITNFEVLALANTAAIDAAKASQFSEFTFKGATVADSFIAKVADTQVINTTADVQATAAGYVAKGGVDADGVTATSTTYAGTLTINAKGGTSVSADTQVDVIANASAVNLNVAANPVAGSLNSDSSYVVLSGDVKTATITLSSAVNNTGIPTSDKTSTVKLTIGTGVNDNTETDAGGYSAVTVKNTALNALGNLTSLTLSGNGVADITNGGTKLATVDASGLNSTSLTGANAGKPSAGLTYTAGAVAETIKLGSSIDTLTFATTASTYAKMDSITGLNLVLDATGAFTNATSAKSDDITVGTVTANAFAKAATGYSTTSLDAALNTLANRESAEKLVFQTGGNTYIFIDTASATTGGVADNDTVIELVGLVDLDALVAALNTNYVA